MALAAHLSPIFNRASSFNNRILRHLLSHSSTDNQSEDVLDPASPPEPQPSAPLNTVVAMSTFEMESRNPTTPAIAAGGDTTSTQQESKRVGKLVQPVALFLGAMSVGLIVKPLESAESHVILVTAHTIFVYLSWFIGVGLSIYSILNGTSPEVARVQKKLMVIGLVFISLAFVLRTCVAFPIASLEVAWPLFFLAITLVVLYVVLARKQEGSSQIGQAPESPV